MSYYNTLSHSYGLSQLFFSVAVQIDGAKDGKYCWFTCYSLKGNKHSQGKGSVTWFTHTQMHSYPKKNKQNHNQTKHSNG